MLTHLRNVFDKISLYILRKVLGHINVLRQAIVLPMNGLHCYEIANANKKRYKGCETDQDICILALLVVVKYCGDYC